MAVREFVFRSRLPVSAERLFEWHENRGAFDRLSPPWQSITPVRFEGIRDGRRAKEAGFTFALPDLDEALRHMLGRT